jgi:hypothetical protein
MLVAITRLVTAQWLESWSQLKSPRYSIHVLDDFLIMEMMGPGFDYAFLPSDQTRGGILVAWRSAIWAASSISTKPCSVSVRMRHITLDVDWWLTLVYGPSRDQDKPTFFSELSKLCQVGPLAANWGFQPNLPCARQEQWSTR